MNPENCYYARVTAKGDDGIGITLGFMLDRQLYDSLQKKHSFPVKEKNKNFIYMSDEEYYRICKVMKEGL